MEEGWKMRDYYDNEEQWMQGECMIEEWWNNDRSRIDQYSMDGGWMGGWWRILDI